MDSHATSQRRIPPGSTQSLLPHPIAPPRQFREEPWTPVTPPQSHPRPGMYFHTKAPAVHSMAASPPNGPRSLPHAYGVAVKAEAEDYLPGFGQMEVDIPPSPMVIPPAVPPPVTPPDWKPETTLATPPPSHCQLPRPSPFPHTSSTPSTPTPAARRKQVPRAVDATAVLDLRQAKPKLTMKSEVEEKLQLVDAFALASLNPPNSVNLSPLYRKIQKPSERNRFPKPVLRVTPPIWSTVEHRLSQLKRTTHFYL